MPSESPETVPQSPPVSIPVHKNKLTQCFDDIIRVAAEMMLHQQLKTVQLDCSVVNGFSHNQQRVLSEKIHVFHAILDDMETTLDKSKNYVEAVYEAGREKEMQREKEREELRRRQDEEERKTKEQEELKRRQEVELKAQEQQQQNGSDVPDLKMEFSMDAPGSLLADFPDAGGQSASGVVQMQKAANAKMQPTMSTSPQRAPIGGPSSAADGVKKEPGMPQNDLSDLGGMDISMFPNMDTGFDMGNFSGEPDKTNVSSDQAAAIPKPGGSNDVGGNLEDTANNGLVDNNDDYLTLNDFNDLNIDWAATGDPGDLDLNGFNI